jgi:peptide/nickel transport system substrate-binding protein
MRGPGGADRRATTAKQFVTVEGRMNRVHRGARIAALVGIAAITACGGGDKGGNKTGGAGGTVVVGMRSDFKGFNPIVTNDQYGMELIAYALFTPLIQYDANLKAEPYLASSWEMNGDTAITFKLRNDVKWHDGQPVTAEDVKFTFDRAKDPTSASLIGSAFLPEVKGATVVDANTIHFSFARPHAQAIEDFWWAPAPKHLLENISATDMQNAPYNRAPVGSGPFKFGEWQANQRLILVKNPDFPASLGGQAKADRVVFRIVPEASTMLTELLTGGVHVDIPVTPDQVDQVKGSGQTTLASFAGRTVYYVGWNNDRPMFKDANVRRALALAINRPEIISALLKGQGELATSTIPPYSPLYPKDIAPLPYDAAQAGKLLDAAGWKDTNGDGIRDKGGKPLQFSILSSDDPLRKQVVEVIQNQLKQVGVKADVKVMEFQTMLAAHKARDYDAVFTNWVLDNFQIASAPYALMHSSQAAIKLSANRSSVRNPDIDKAIEAGTVATDEAQQKAAWHTLTEVLQRDQPITFMFWLRELAATRNEMTGVAMDPRGELRTIRDWTAGH